MRIRFYDDDVLDCGVVRVHMHSPEWRIGKNRKYKARSATMRKQVKSRCCGGGAGDPSLSS